MNPCTKRCVGDVEILIQAGDTSWTSRRFRRQHGFYSSAIERGKTDADIISDKRKIKHCIVLRECCRTCINDTPVPAGGVACIDTRILKVIMHTVLD